MHVTRLLPLFVAAVAASFLLAEAPPPTPAQIPEASLTPSTVASPRYPEVARKALLQGQSVIRITAASDGTVVDATLLRGVSIILDTRALRAAKQWQFVPFIGTARTMDLTFTWRLGESEITWYTPESGVVVQGRHYVSPVSVQTVY